MEKNYSCWLPIILIAVLCTVFTSCGGDDDPVAPTPTPSSKSVDRDASGNLKISAINFPDENFRSFLLTQDYGTDGVLTNEEIAGVTSLNVSKKSIQSLQGIEFFTALTKLECFKNQLTSLNISKNMALKYLDCYDNQLTSLDISKNSALTDLYCENNKLTSLDVSKNMGLEWLTCGYNQLTSLVVSKNIELISLWCPNNQLTSLDVSKNTSLEYLHCDANQLTALDVSKNTALTNLYCNINKLTSLDVSRNTALIKLWCGENQLTSLDVSKNTVLTDLYCGSNNLTSLDVTNNPKLENFIYDKSVTVIGWKTNIEKPIWENYTTDLTAYIQLSESLKPYASNADELAAFCGNESRGNGTYIDGVWCIKIWGNVGDKITLKYYCATNKYMYHSAETIELKDNERFGTFDEPKTIYFIIDK